MNYKSWLPYINLVTLVILILLFIVLAIVGVATFNSGGYSLGLTIAQYPYAFVEVTAIVIIGFLLVLALNFLIARGEKAGWIILIATVLFIPIAICLTSLAIFALPMTEK